MIRSWIIFTAGVVCLLLGGSLLRAQPLDWFQDVTVFGTTGNEGAPAIAIIPTTGVIRAWCVCDESNIIGKLSLNGGSTWSEAACRDTSAPVRATACSDGQFAYVLEWNPARGARNLWRFPSGDNSWNSARQITIAPDRVHPVYAACAATDFEFQPVDPYLNVCWVDSGVLAGYVQGWFAQSRDRGLTMNGESMIFEGRVSPEAQACVSMATAWNEDRETMFIATSLDRPGSIPHQIRLFASENEGGSWNESEFVDATTFDQTEPSLAAYEQFLLIVYTRRVIVGQQSDIFYTYSVDAGSTFAVPRALASDVSAEHSPRAVVSGTMGMFSVFYVTETDSGGATVCVREGLLSTPHELAQAVMISGAGEAEETGDLAVVSGPQGAAALWTRRFPLGDTDVCFDAAWRTSSSAVRPVPSAAGITGCYPNPFNGCTVLRVVLTRAQNVDIEITDILGRSVKRFSAGLFPAGDHAIRVDLAGAASGLYFAGESDSPHPPQRLILMR
ncbi:MAG: hypothetical protein PHI18_01225 [bacterium]|nr:hypothetical protein [bacterium]